MVFIHVGVEPLVCLCLSRQHLHSVGDGNVGHGHTLQRTAMGGGRGKRSVIMRNSTTFV